MAIKVRAVFSQPNQFGFYGTQRRRNGDVFEIETEKHFSNKWMERVNDPKPAEEPAPEAPTATKGKK